MVELSVARYGVRKWAEKFDGLRQLPAVMASPPSITVGTNGAVSAITGAAQSTLSVPPLDARLSWIGAAPSLIATGYYAGTNTGKRLRFVHAGRRFEMLLQSGKAQMPSILVNGQPTTNATTLKGLTGTGHHLVLVDFGADTLTQTCEGVTSIAGGGSGYALLDEVTLAGGTFGTQVVAYVTHVSGGVIDGIALKTPGSYTALPSNPVSVASTTGAGTGATFNLVFGPAHTTVATREIEIILPASCSFGGLNIDTNDTVSIWPEKTKVPKLLISGDSFSDSNYPNYIAGNWTRQLATMLGLDDRFVQMGTSGRGFLVAGNLFASDLTNIITEAPDLYVCALGVNDSLQAANTTTLQSTAASNLQTLMTALPFTRFVILTPWFVSNSAYTTAILNAAAALSDQTRVRTVNLQALGLYVAANTSIPFISSDAIHPSQAGHDYLARELSGPIAAAFLDMAA